MGCEKEWREGTYWPNSTLLVRPIQRKMALMPTKPRILLVDDDPDISLALLDYLRKEGFEVDLSETGTAALSKGTTHTYDVALLDVGLPDLDGIQVLAELADKKPELPIILLTAFTTLQKTTNPEIIDKAFAYLTKPYNREGVKATIERAIIRPVLPGGKDGTQLSLPQTVLPSPSFLQTKGSIASATSGSVSSRAAVGFRLAPISPSAGRGSRPNMW